MGAHSSTGEGAVDAENESRINWSPTKSNRIDLIRIYFFPCSFFFFSSPLQLLLFDSGAVPSPPVASLPMSPNKAHGEAVWEARGKWSGMYYNYEIEVREELNCR